MRLFRSGSTRNGCLFKRLPVAFDAGNRAGGIGRPGDDPYPPVSQIQEMTRGKIAAEPVIADCRQAVMVRPQCQHIRNTPLPELIGEIIVVACCRQDQSIDPTVNKGFRRQTICLGPILRRCNDRRSDRCGHMP